MRGLRIGVLAFGIASVAIAGVPLVIPGADSMPTGALGDAVRYGQTIVNDTQNTVASYVGNGLTCSQCHIGGGTVVYAAPFAGLPGLFPEYRSRTGRVETLEERINDCFLRSMNGQVLPAYSREMIALLAYIGWLSQGVPGGVEVTGRGFRDIRSPTPPDATRGKALYAERCSACHGANGQGVRASGRGYAFPPLWGADSFNQGAGMARVSIAAAFIQTKMPLGAGGTLTDQEAYDIAAYVTSQPRPAFSKAASDWPHGDAPPDATTGRRPAATH
ncbi:MAG TPA: c-type cytochrome [Casimicrobiaceae bacterium]